MAFNAAGFPSPIADDNTKKSPEYGLQVANAAYGPYMSSNSYMYNRNANYAENDLFFQGNQPLAPYLKLLDTDGKDSYLNIDFSPVPIVKKYGKIVINGYMNVEEKVSATSMNKLIKERKEKKRAQAEFRMAEAEYIANLQEQSGIQFEDPNAFVPETTEELDVWAEMNDKEREELLMQEALGFSFKDNEIFSSLKERILTNGFKKALAVAYVHLDENGKIKVKDVPPENFIYGNSRRNDLADCQYHGHVEEITIAEARIRFGTEEKFLYEIARSVGGIFGNGAANWPWDNGWLTAYARPYDNFIVRIMHIWYRTSKNINYVKGETSRGRKVFDIVNGVPAPTNSKKQAGQKRVATAYEGWWYINTDVMAEWGEAKNQIRRNPNLEYVESPYIAYMWDNDGNMNPTSRVDNIKEAVRQMDLANIKIQQIMAKAAPDGYFVDIDGLSDIELSKGLGAVPFTKLMSIAQQTGMVYYRSASMSGDPNMNRKPIEPNQTGFGQKLQELIGIYTWNLNKIRDYLGINEIREGSGVNPKMGLGVAQEQLVASNNATADLYAGWISIGSRIAKAVGQLIWDQLKYGSEYEGYKKFLGQENVAFLKEAKHITDSNYDLDLKIKAMPYEKEQLAADVQTALSAGLIEMEDAVAIKAFDDSKLAYRYMVVVQKKRKREKMEEAAANSEMNAKSQQESAAAKAQGDASVAQAKAQGEMMVITAKMSGEQKNEYRKFLYDMQLEAFKMSKPLPPGVQAQFDAMLAEDAEQKQLEQDLIEQEYGTEQQAESV